MAPVDEMARSYVTLGPSPLRTPVRRCARHHHLRRRRLPPGLPAGRLGRRRRLLRPFGLPDHQPAPGERPAAGEPGGLLGSPGQAAAPRRAGAPGCARPVCMGQRGGTGAGPTPCAEPGHVVLRRQLAADRSWSQLLRPVLVGQPAPADLVTGHRGAVLRDLAAGDPGHHRRDPDQAKPPRRFSRPARHHRDPGRGLGGVDGAGRALARAEPGLSGYRTPAPGNCSSAARRR